MYLRGFRTRRNGSHYNVIDITGIVTGCRLRGSEGDVRTSADVLAQRNLIVGVGVGGGDNGVDRHKGVDVSRIRHHTHL